MALEGHDLKSKSSSGLRIKQLRSTVADLRALFDDRITARYLAESFVAFDSVRSTSDVRAFMKHRDFDFIGVRIHGEVVGFADFHDLDDGKLGDHVRPFASHHLVDETDSVSDVLNRLRQEPCVYVQLMGQPLGIITRADLQKAPVRMWLFALLSLVEMQFLRLIRTRLTEEELLRTLEVRSSKRVQGEFNKRKKRNEETDLADCTGFSDKFLIVAKTMSLREELGFGSEDAVMVVKRDYVTLRNNLAHGHIIGRDFSNLARIAKGAEDLLHQCEAMN